MEKWYETNVNNLSIISSRIRLARNFKGHVFPICAASDEVIEIMDNTARSLAKHSDDVRMIRIDSIDDIGKRLLIEKHLISPILADEKKPSCVFINNAENISIMMMEEDHIRIQAMEPGDNIEKAFENACLIDEIIEKGCEYAFHEDWGYLTSCPTNVGTGLRASFMIHTPYLEKSGQITDIGRSLSKFGFTVRGTFGEGTDAFGAVYQISNQVSLGLTEVEIINNLKNITNQVLAREQALMQKDFETNRLAVEDAVFRNYGTLKNARIMTEKEAINCLSTLKTGIICGIIDVPLPSIYNLIINVRSAGIANKYKLSDESQIPIKRAEYLREQL